MSERKEIEEEEEEVACWDLGHSSVRLSLGGLPETEADLCSGSIPDSSTLVQLHVQKQRPMMAARGCAAMTTRKEGTLPNASRGGA